MRITLLLLATSLLNACFAPKVIKQERVIFQSEIANNPNLATGNIEIAGDRLFYVFAGDAAKPALIIIHGTPSNWNQYARYMLDQDLLENFQVIVIDRPGWGNSVLNNDREIASFANQAKLIAALANQLKHNNQGRAVILMGHSLGASLAPKVAMDYPQSVDGLLLFAGAIDPELANPRWFNYLGKIRLVNWFLGGSMRKANKEVFALKAELQAMAPEWRQLDQPTLVVQGLKDNLVYPANSQFAQKRLNPGTTQVIELPEEGHLFPMTRRSEVVSWAKCLLKSIEGSPQNCSS